MEWSHSGWPAGLRRAMGQLPLRQWGMDTVLAGALSVAALVWRGRRELGSAAAPLNAPSHMLWGERALRRNALTWQFTGSGTTLHVACAAAWAGLYRVLRLLRRHPDRNNALVDAATVTAVAAAVDLRLAPTRWTPGFERRLSPRGLAWVYAGFAAGLALGGLSALAARRRRST